MTTVGLRELRQDASNIVRRVEQGEEISITVSGRPSVRLVPEQTARWRAWEDIADLFDGPEDVDWAQDRELLEDEITDPWARRS